ncbi:hypothetical protein ONZ45_g18549 [Pleurotus djamor]|nr:hypothetical protein ONZ45_g18549 [Pleurotus djamor]
MNPTISTLVILCVVLTTTSAAPVPPDCDASDPFIHGLPGWKPWYGIGPVIRPIVKHQRAKWPTSLPDGRPESPELESNGAAQALGKITVKGDVITTPSHQPAINDGLNKREHHIGIKGWHPLFGKGPIIFGWKGAEAEAPSDK